MGLSKKLIEQGKKPTGFIGHIMLKIMNFAHKEIINWGLSKINIADNSIILDLGCGGGETIKILSNYTKNGKVYGIDYSKEAIKTSAKVNKTAISNGKVVLKQSYISNIPFKDNFFNIITAFQTHYFWENLKTDIKEINRVLKDKGQFLLVAELYKIDYHMKEYKTPESMEKLLLKSGFNNVNTFKTNKNICFIAKKNKL